MEHEVIQVVQEAPNNIILALIRIKLYWALYIRGFDLNL